MTSWADLIEALAARKPEIKMVPPRPNYEDLWDQRHRIEALETEVRDLKLVLEQVLIQLQNNNTPYFRET